jgi:hypothetical protein
MKVELDKEGLISLVKGTMPNFSIMSDPLIKKNGSYRGGFVDGWEWNFNAFENSTEEEIYKAYLMIKNSWKE